MKKFTKYKLVLCAFAAVLMAIPASCIIISIISVIGTIPTKSAAVAIGVIALVCEVMVQCIVVQYMLNHAKPPTDNGEVDYAAVDRWVLTYGPIFQGGVAIRISIYALSVAILSISSTI